jgi:PIN domain nuclease of toxin-antitoxin system
MSSRANEAGTTIVLDTHAWIDIAYGRARLSKAGLRAVDRAATQGDLYVAAITPWEIAMLIRAGKLRVPSPILEWIEDALLATKTVVAPLDPQIAVDAVDLPAWEHADPADRLIVATARALSARLVTRDAAILEYAEAVRAVRVIEA